VPGRAGPWPRETWQRAPAGLGLESASGAGRETTPTSGARRSAGEREEGAGVRADWAGSEEWAAREGKRRKEGRRPRLAWAVRGAGPRAGGKRKGEGKKAVGRAAGEGEKGRKRGGKVAGWAGPKGEKREGKEKKSKTNAFEFENEI
jgi:hypothetical protein